MLRKVSLLSIFIILFSCSTYDKYKNNIEFYEDSELFRKSMKKLSDIIVYDIFSPPVASRIYVYPTIAAYEVLINDNPSYKSFSGQLTDLNNIPKPDLNLEYSFPLASIHAFLTVGKDLIFSENKIIEFQKNLYDELKSKGIPNDIYKRSISYGEEVARHIMNWYDNDNYKKINPEYFDEKIY